MAKVQYPKKFRQKLEKIAAAREARERGEEPDLGPAFETLWHEFLPRGSVEFIATRMDEQRPRIHADY